MCEQFKFKEKKIEYKSMFLNVILFYFSIINNILKHTYGKNIYKQWCAFNVAMLEDTRLLEEWRQQKPAYFAEHNEWEGKSWKLMLNEKLVDTSIFLDYKIGNYF
jgi:hypothetical protein